MHGGTVSGLSHAALAEQLHLTNPMFGMPEHELVSERWLAQSELPVSDDVRPAATPLNLSPSHLALLGVGPGVDEARVFAVDLIAMVLERACQTITTPMTPRAASADVDKRWRNRLSAYQMKTAKIIAHFLRPTDQQATGSVDPTMRALDIPTSSIKPCDSGNF